MARDFDGVNDKLLSVNNIGISGSTNRSCFIWIRRTGANSDQGLLEWGVDSTGNRWTFRLHTTAMALRIEIQVLHDSHLKLLIVLA